MKEMMRFGLVLGVICMISAGSLAGVNLLTKSRILAQAHAEESSSLREVFPDAAGFEAVKSGDQISYYKVFDTGGKLIGAAFKASGRGYSSEVVTVAGMLLDGTITAVKVVSQNETPGLGTRITDSVFARQFRGKDAAQLAGVQAIAGATISSRAVMESVKKKAAQVKGLLNHEK